MTGRPRPCEVGIALFGANGHQIHRKLPDVAGVQLVGLCDLPVDALPPGLRERSPTVYPDFQAMLNDPRVDLVVMCDPVRAAQADHAIVALQAGKHVYAEKPCSTNLRQFDELMNAADAAAGRGIVFREMAGTALGQPWASVAQVVSRGELGEVVQVVASKSYRYHAGRPQDAEQLLDGGLMAQAGVHAVRFIEHVAGLRVVAVTAQETHLGNPVVGGGMHTACSMQLRCRSGAIAVVTANYLNPQGFGAWGNDGLTIYGTRGMCQVADNGRATRLIVEAQDLRPLPPEPAGPNHFECLVAHLRHGQAMPWSLAEEVHPTRVVLTARKSAAEQGRWLDVDSGCPA